MDTKNVPDNKIATCAACHHEHKEIDGSCSCGCKEKKEKTAQEDAKVSGN